MQQKLILPVIHHLNFSTSLAEGSAALSAGADGIFLISHNGGDEELFAPAMTIKNRFPDKRVGLNLLRKNAKVAMAGVRSMELDMVWTDNPGITSSSISSDAHEISKALSEKGASHRRGINSHKIELFGSIAFKYQPFESEPGIAAKNCSSLGFIPTTSGAKTGEPPLVAKAVAMRAEIGSDAPFAVASGMTPYNVGHYLEYFSHFLVFTGISKTEYHLCHEKLDSFIRAVHG